MIDYCKHIVCNFHESFEKRTFSQNDVALLYNVARDYFPQKSMFREIGDFLAHPKAKDRGIVISDLDNIVPEFEKNIPSLFRNNCPTNRKRQTVSGINLNRLIQDLGSVFSKANITVDSLSISSEKVRDFIFCTIFLLSGFKVKYQNRLLNMRVWYSKDLSLQLVYSSQKYSSINSVLPLLTLYNANPNLGYGCLPYFKILNNHIAQRFEEGFLGAISYEKDAIIKQYDLKSFDSDQVWPLFPL